MFIAFVAGVATYVDAPILGVPFRAPLAVIAGLFSLIPLVGATIAAVLIGVVTLFEDFPTATIIWAIWAIVYQQFENHVIQPQVQKRTVNVHPFVTIVSVLIGSTLLGVLGALAGDPGRRVDPDPAARVLRPAHAVPAPGAAATARGAASTAGPGGRSGPGVACRACPRAQSSGAALLLAVTAVSLYLLAPALLNVFGAWDRLDDVNPLWFAGDARPAGGELRLHVGGPAASRCARGAGGPVITSQLASNAFGRVVPGGVAASGAHAVRDAQRARGSPPAAAASGMTASSVLVFGTLCALPVLAVPGGARRRAGGSGPRAGRGDRRGRVRAHVRARRGLSSCSTGR